MAIIQEDQMGAREARQRLSPIPEYDLFKHPVQADTLAIVQYLQWAGCEGVLPRFVVERDHGVGMLPAIREVESGLLHEGVDACVGFFEGATGVTHLPAVAAAFKAAHPTYRCRGVLEGRRCLA